MDTDSFSFDLLPADQLEKFDRFTRLLIQENQKHNLTRIIDEDDIKIRHYCDSLVAMDVINDLNDKRHPRIIDIGSGAGFPSLPLAIAMPEAKVTSLDSTGKKINFQKLVMTELGLENFTPVHGRAEELAHDKNYRNHFDFAVSRAVGDLRILLEITIGFIKPGGFFLVWKGQRTEEEIEHSQAAFDALRADIADVVPYNLTGPDDKFNIIVIQKTMPTPAKYPRIFKTIKQAPL